MIYYFCPDHDVPSWGVGMLYYHVHFLSKNNFEVCILHSKRNFKLSWLNLNVPIKYIQDSVCPRHNDILVVPEFYISDKIVRQFKCRKLLFVQNSFILFERISPKEMNNLGYEAVLYYMPHLQKVLTTYFNGPIYEIPPFIADYYYKDEDSLHNRKKSIIIYPKTENRDFNILEKFLESDYTKKSFLIGLISSEKQKQKWEIVVLKNLSHQKVAKLMQQATFFINLNTHEAFNSSVPEAMAAGCINFTYDAFGPSDFLINNKNAFVFNNNHIFPLYESLQFYINKYDDAEVIEELTKIRNAGFQTAKSYVSGLAEIAIANVFKKLISL